LDKKMSLPYIPLSMDKIGNKIREIRAQRGIKAQEVAKKLGVLKSTYSAMELGDRKIKAEELPAIAKALGVDIAELYDQEQLSASDRVFNALGVRLSEIDAETLEEVCKTEDGRVQLAELLAGIVSMPEEKRQALVLLAKNG
jgi:transcriptional regulator with XRE-family HTH domain